jgi:uncharacterized protein involved in exopolysaccharide biosynthesis
MDHNSKETKIDIKDALAIVRHRKWLIILPLVLVTIIAFAGSYFLEERYQSSTMVVIDQTKFLSKQLQAMMPGQEQGRFSSMQQRSFLIALYNEIISSSYLKRMIDELGLADDDDIIQMAQKMHTKRPDIPVKSLVYHILINKLRQNIDVEFNGENIIEITAESSDPSQAMAIATKMAEIFKDERLKRELSGVRGALDFSDEQLERYKANLDEAERKKAEFVSEYLKNQLDESVTAEGNIRAVMADVDNLKLLIDDNIKEQAEIRTRLSKYKKSELVLDTGEEYESIRGNINAESERLTEFMSRYTWSDPKVLNANLRISNLLQDLDQVIRRRVNEQFRNAPASERADLAEFFSLQTREMIFRNKLNDFEVALATLRDRISRMPQFEINMRNLENDVNSARTIYEKFRDQQTGTEISQSLMRGEKESKYRIMEPASVPMVPVKPNRVKITVLGAILGLVIGGVAALLAELLDNSFKKVEDVEDYLDLSVLATIPNISSIKGKVKVQ